jgi:TonB family protein
MNKNQFPFHFNRLRYSGTRLMQAIVLALMVALTIPAMAADSRAVKSRVAPIYPEIARRMKISGVVKVEATVDAEGKVTEVKMISGNSLLAFAAEDAVRKWKFEPGPGVAKVEVSLTFSLSA